ncbi:Glu/Leu/Phe/Val dehydrogenase [Egibacter rhizosphaerae]|uniref:Glu/Leu/Phe/Val dehydrogenase n=1 Tax=Egibacter rhizosphaerae TaxID=1670831 RepID=A0A411YFZ1_9ACTN|nr:Glu/Leu/Phe/Val dehydrogenase dimerization domain-containing protein [Egibacter rhizosphaerae]QBI20185.1 Glu/Leu/Phe/Val dehydrogenase [Egibacter rhizosphaerae]
MRGPFAAFNGHEQVLYGADDESGLRCIIAIHSTALGPALGGTRMLPYESEEDALEDVLRLSEAMTYKAAVAGIDTGGGKAVIIGDPETDKTEALLRAYGRMIGSLGGRYTTACDVGTYPDDIATILRETPHAVGAPPEEHGSGDSGVSTALGTYEGLRACAEERWGDPRLGGKHVAVQGVGKVGHRLVHHLAEEGARVSVADVDEDRAARCAEETRAEVVAPDKIHAVDCDIFSPNALGEVVTDRTIGELSCEIVAGAANNQLSRADLADELRAAGILYAPDYVINAGGLIQVADELRPGGYQEPRARRRVARIGDRLREVFALSRQEDVSTEEAAHRVAGRRIHAISRLTTLRLPGRD